jgi:CRP/FNR family transcriptional regulator
MKWKAPKPNTSSAVGEPAQPSYACAYPAFAPIVSDAFEQIKGLPDPTSNAASITLIEQGQQISSVLLLRSGLVKLTHITPEGREAVLGLRSAGWYAGAVSALMHTPSIYSVKTVTSCSFSRIAADDFPLRLMQSAKLMRHFMNTLCSELLTQSAEAQIMNCSAEQRLAHFMHERTSSHPELKTLDALPLLKQMELAQLLAITPEHLSRLLHKLSASEEPHSNSHHIPATPKDFTLTT